MRFVFTGALYANGCTTPRLSKVSERFGVSAATFI